MLKSTQDPTTFIEQLLKNNIIRKIPNVIIIKSGGQVLMDLLVSTMDFGGALVTSGGPWLPKTVGVVLAHRAWVTESMAR